MADADYKQMYLTLLDATEKAINSLISTQRACEEMYILYPEQDKKSMVIKLTDETK